MCGGIKFHYKYNCYGRIVDILRTELSEKKEPYVSDILGTKRASQHKCQCEPSLAKGTQTKQVSTDLSH